MKEILITLVALFPWSIVAVLSYMIIKEKRKKK